MIFNYVIGIQNKSNECNLIKREAVRAVIHKDNKLLMIHTNRGDYKFPGGGIKKDENHIEAIKREVMEESGCNVDSVREKIGMVVERRPDMYEPIKIFEMTSLYYVCKISSERTSQKLDNYEAELGFEPKWISIDEAISSNKKYLDEENYNANNWVEREIYVLNQLKNYFSCN